MTDASQIAAANRPETQSPAYARFSRRLQAVMIDYMILVVGLVAALMLATASNMTSSARLIGLAAAAAMLLYEPFFVSTFGGTIGHTRRNMRVVDDRTGGNIHFLKAVARLVIKTLLGWLSFLAMATTRRHQPLHDLWTASTVQIRDVERAERHHYSEARIAPPVVGMPSALRRSIVISGYIALSFRAMCFGIFALNTSGQISSQCITAEICTPSENAWTSALSLIFLALTAAALYLGWRGHLAGCRHTAK